MTRVSNMSKPAQSGVVDIQGFALRIIRERTGKSMPELAAELDVDRSYINHIELGRSRRVSTEFYVRLLRVLQISEYRALLANPMSAEVAA